jgi:hypothetical protein
MLRTDGRVGEFASTLFSAIILKPTYQVFTARVDDQRRFVRLGCENYGHLPQAVGHAERHPTRRDALAEHSGVFIERARPEERRRVNRIKPDELGTVLRGFEEFVQDRLCVVDQHNVDGKLIVEDG